MRRTPGASLSGCWRVCAVPLIIGMLLATPGLAVAQPGSPDTIGALVAAVANANQKLQDLGAAIQAQQESVNKAIVDVQTARDNAAAAQQEVDASAQRVAEANTAIAAAQQRFDTFAAATYVNGPSDSYLTASDPADILSTAAAGQTLSVSSQQVHHQSSARPHRAGEQGVGRAVGQAERRQGGRRRGSQSADRGVGAHAGAADVQVAAGRAGPVDGRTRRRAGQTRRGPQLVGTRGRSAGRPARRGCRPATRRRTGIAHPVRATRAPETGTPHGIPRCPRSRARSSAATRSRSSTPCSGIASTSAQVTQQMGHNFLQKLGLIPTPSGYTNGAIPRVYGRQASEYVINRGLVAAGRSVLLGRRQRGRTPATASIPARAQSDSTAPG